MRKNQKAGINQIGGLGLKMFSDDDLYAIHCATLDVLKNTGIKVESAEARNLFDGAGARVDNNKLVKIPPYLVEDSIRSAPGSVLLAARDPDKDFIVEDKRVGFVNFGEGINIIDPFTREYRLTRKEDCANAALLSDYLDQMDISYRAVASQDVSPKVESLHNAEAIFPNTTKHFFIGPDGRANCKKIIKMAEAVAGGKENLMARPLISFNLCPTSPLQLISDCTDIVIEGARAGIPSNIISMALAGATAPVTLAGALVTHNAEVLSTVILSQLACKGAPVLYGSSTTFMDLRYTTSPVGSPELGLINAAVAKLAQYYKLPSFVAGG